MLVEEGHILLVEESHILLVEEGHVLLGEGGHILLVEEGHYPPWISDLPQKDVHIPHGRKREMNDVHQDDAGVV